MPKATGALQYKAMPHQSEEIFNAMIEAVSSEAETYALKPFEAFPRWFAGVFFDGPKDFRGIDGANDGKADLFFRTATRKGFKHYVINAKFTNAYGSTAPVAFYEELTWLARAFEGDEDSQQKYLNLVRRSERGRFKTLFDEYRHGNVELLFLTNHKRNDKRADAFDLPIRMFHLQDLIEIVVDDYEDAMPVTEDLVLTDVDQPLSPSREASSVPTWIVFAKLADFQRYMKNDPRGLLFARNIRLIVQNSKINEAIADTYLKAPEEFAFTHNGLTVLCDERRWDDRARSLTIENPRVVNGSQTLHSIEHLATNEAARAMVRITQVEHVTAADSAEAVQRKKAVIDKIATRSNSQNPIKSSDLRANDHFQHGLARTFRQHDLFYRRRAGEWEHRRSELKPLGIDAGPRMQLEAQLLSSFYWGQQGLGPADAKNSVNLLFEDDFRYDSLRQAEPELAVQLYFLHEHITAARRSIQKKKTYARMVSEIGRHSELTVLCLVAKALQSADADWGADGMTDWLYEYVDLEPLVQRVLIGLYRDFRTQAAAHKRDTAKVLTANNYFKSRKYIDPVVSQAPSNEWVMAARKLLPPSART